MYVTEHDNFIEVYDLNREGASVYLSPEDDGFELKLDTVGFLEFFFRTIK